MECIIFMIHLLQLLVDPLGVYTVILVLHIHMGLHQLFVSDVICNHSVLHLWYEFRHPVFLWPFVVFLSFLLCFVVADDPNTHFNVTILIWMDWSHFFFFFLKCFHHFCRVRSICWKWLSATNYLNFPRIWVSNCSINVLPYFFLFWPYNCTGGSPSMLLFYFPVYAV